MTWGDFTDYLNLLDAAERLPSNVIWSARNFAALLRLQFDLPPPSAVPTPVNTLQLVWDLGEHHLEIEIDAKNADWFYRNRKTEAIASGLHPALEVPVELKEYLKFLATRRST